MLKSFILSVFFLGIASDILAQNYYDLIKKADSLYQVKEYNKSNLSYQQAFKLTKPNSNDLYNAACSAALSEDTTNAFIFLNLALQNGWINVSRLDWDPDLKGLHSDERWSKLVAVMQAKTIEIEKNYDKPLQKELLDIWEDDQAIRQNM